MLDVPPGRRAQPELGEQRAEAAAILGGVDRVERVAEQRHACLGQAGREPERRLAAERDDDAERPLVLDDVEHVLQRHRLEIEPVAGVVVGRHGLRVRVHEHDLVAEPARKACAARTQQ